MELKVEHNLDDEQLTKTVIALVKSHSIEYEVHECLQKSVTINPVEPRDPLLAELYRQFQGLFMDASDWIRHLVEKVVAGEVERTSFFLFKAKAQRQYPDGPLSKEEVQYIQNAIRERFNYIAKALESDFVPDKKLLKKWKDLGIISQDVTAQDFVSAADGGKLVRNAFIFGRLHMAIEKGATTFDEILKVALEAPVTRPDNFAIEAAERSAAQYITKFGEDVSTEAARLIDAKNRQIVHDMVVKVHAQQLQAIKLHEGAPDKLVTSWKQLSSELYHTMGDKARDWDRIAYAELMQSEKEGRALALLEKWGPEQFVYKMPLKTACPQCRYLYIDQTKSPPVPRLFRLGTMLGYGNNIGRKPLPVKSGVVANDERPDGKEGLKPVVGLVHPWCQCSGIHVATGMEWWYEQAIGNK